MTLALDPTLRAVVGLDLGKLSDFSALALLTWQLGEAPLPSRFGPTPAPQPKRREFNVPTLHRWPLSTPYTEVATGLIEFCRQPPLCQSETLLVLDATGVGEPVCDLIYVELVKARIPMSTRWVTITPGSAVSLVSDGRWHVAKKHLVSTLQVLLGTRRLHVAPDQPHAGQLVRELETFQVKLTTAGNETFEAWRERDHDDLVLAVALACWGAVSWPPPPPKRVDRLWA